MLFGLLLKSCKKSQSLFPCAALGRRLGPVGTQAVRCLSIVVYIGIGVAVFVVFESKGCPPGHTDAGSGTFDAGSGNAGSGNAGSGTSDAGSGVPDTGNEVHCTVPLSIVDGLYLSVVTISTVGYGDLGPHGVGMRCFTMVYVFFGCSYIFVMLSQFFAGVLERYRSFILSIIDKFDTTAKTVAADTTGDGRMDTKHAVSGRSSGLSGKGIDLSGDGQVDFIAPPAAVVFWLQELLPAFLLWISFQLASSGVFTVVEPGLDFFTAFYHCFITATTVGYGDVSITTDAARLWASAHILVSVSWLAALLGQIEASSSERKAQLQRLDLLTKPLDREQMLSLDKDGGGISCLEFVTGMLIMLGVELCGEPLKWDDVRPFIQKFDELDQRGEQINCITREDLEEYLKQYNGSRQANRKTAVQQGSVKQGSSSVAEAARAVLAHAPGASRLSRPAEPSASRSLTEASASRSLTRSRLQGSAALPRGQSLPRPAAGVTTI